MEDAGLLLQWRNHDTIRKHMKNNNQIDWKDHLQWLESKLLGNDTLLFVHETRGKPDGFMKLDKWKKDPKVAEWGFYIAPDAEAGTGTIMCKAALALAFDQLGFEKIAGEVLHFNERSLKLHKKLGFRVTGNNKTGSANKQQDGIDDSPQDIVCFEITRNEWLRQ